MITNLHHKNIYFVKDKQESFIMITNLHHKNIYFVKDKSLGIYKPSLLIVINVIILYIYYIYI